MNHCPICKQECPTRAEFSTHMALSHDWDLFEIEEWMKDQTRIP
jgi:hypothetical protein